MKPYEYRFEKVLTFREQEKSETEIEFKKSVESFEAVATELYNLLRKKEETLQEQQDRMATGFSVNGIHYYARYLASLEKKIYEVQQKVIHARTKMNWYEEKLMEKTMEVRKFEKMKEKDRANYQIEMEHQENERLDELSTLKFRGNQDR